MKKKLFILFFALSSLTASAGFSDIYSSPYLFAISEFEQNGIINGYPDGTFRPEANIKRAEFVKILLEATDFDGSVDSNVSLPFSDVDESQWYAPYVKEAYRLGVVNGYPDGTFRPNANINIAEAYKIVMATFFNVESIYDGGEYYANCHDDLSASKKINTNDWYWKYFYVADSMCTIPEDMQKRMPQGFDPSEFLQRGEMVFAVYNSMNLTDLELSYGDHSKKDYLQEYALTPLNPAISYNESYNYYQIEGNTIDDLMEQMNTLGSGQYWAYANWQVILEL